jgi:hypothetical protein
MATSCDAPRRAVRSSFDAVAFTRRRMGSERVVVGTFTRVIERRRAREPSALR